LGKAGDSFENIAEDKGFSVGVAKKRRRPIFVRMGMKMEDTFIRTDSGEGRIASK
jgi:hypothetical protein